MLPQHPETNPYFGFGTPRNQVQEQRSGLATPQPQRGHGDQPQTQPSGVAQPQSQGQHTQPPPQPVPSEMQRPRDQFFWPPTQPSTELRPTKKTKHQGPRNRDRDRDRERQKPMGAWTALVPEGRDQSAAPQATEPTNALGQPQHSGTQPQVTQAKHQELQLPERRSPHQQDQRSHHRHGRLGLVMPTPRRTKPITWFLAGFCAIFWMVIILGGLIVLIVYLVFRPHSPNFDVSGVTLNAAYLDVDVLLNADLTVLAKFTNPNKKVKVDFSYVVLDLYYGNTMIASQYIEPFRAARLQTRLANVHMITSQVRLPLEETERLRREIERNAITFQVKGVFRARSSLGSFLRYSYRLYGHCTIVVTGPPTGVIKAVKCKTKR